MNFTLTKNLMGLILGALLLSLNPLAAQNSHGKILVNSKEFNTKNCQKLSAFKSVNLIEEKDDSIRVEILLAVGATGKGAKAFKSIKDFNSFDIVTWLKSERIKGNTHSMYLDEEGNSQTKHPAKAGDRFMVLLYKGDKLYKSYVILFC